MYQLLENENKDLKEKRKRWYPLIALCLVVTVAGIADACYWTLNGNDLIPEYDGWCVQAECINVTDLTVQNLYYAEMWNYSSPAYNFIVAESGIYYNGSFLSCGHSLNTLCTEETQDNGGTYFTINKSGAYKIDAFISGEGFVVGGQYGVGVGFNFSIGQRHCYGRVDGTNDANIIAITCIEYLANGTTINLLFEEEDNPVKGFLVYSANLNIQRIGEV